MTRVFDVIFSLCAILFLSPLLLPIVIALKFTGEGEVFYSQIRVGRSKKEFALLKFATMLKDSPNIGSGTITLKNDPRVLPFGKFLRRTKLNELPQLFNVLMGTMSLIGPRPQAKRNFDFFPEEAQTSIASVRPGLSGIGSIVFSNEENLLDNVQSEDFYVNVVMPYKAELELFYVENNNLSMYVNLIALTCTGLFLGKNYLSKLYPTLPKPPNELSEYLDI
jgi:lipopolysaccharide/colanic/teichoic acid biosynthesis glycosyltransferase